jgi:hypothetical protein
MMLTSIDFVPKSMAAPQVIPPHPQIDEFQLQITLMKRDGHTHSQVLFWLQEQGVYTSIATLKRWLIASNYLTLTGGNMLSNLITL